jgi:hypothetical protein
LLFSRRIAGLCNEKAGKYGPFLPLAQQISLKSDRLLGYNEPHFFAKRTTVLQRPRKKALDRRDKLRSSLDAAVYKHVVLGLIFMKYVSDAFEERQKELRPSFRTPAHDYYMAPDDYADDYEGNLAAELEVRDYYTEKNVFWVPLEARWQTLR